LQRRCERSGDRSNRLQQLLRARIGEVGLEEYTVALSIVRARDNESRSCFLGKRLEIAGLGSVRARRELRRRARDINEAGARGPARDPVRCHRAERIERTIAALVGERRNDHAFRLECRRAPMTRESDQSRDESSSSNGAAENAPTPTASRHCGDRHG